MGVLVKRFADSSWGSALIGLLLATSAGLSAAEIPVDAFLATSPFHVLAAEVRIETADSADPQTLNRIGIVEDGDDALLLRLHLIRNAKHSIDLQTFIWSDDESARFLGNELMLAAQRGVQVRLLLDHMWLEKDAERFAFDETVVPNLEIKVYRPAAKRMRTSWLFRVAEAIMPTGTNQRMHNKLMIVDGALGITGGRNIGNEYFNRSSGYNFIDREALVIGPQVTEMTRSFDAYWAFEKTKFNYELYDVARHIENGNTREPAALEDFAHHPLFVEVHRDANSWSAVQERFVAGLREPKSLRFVADDPGQKTRFHYLRRRYGGAVSDALIEALQAAEHELLLQSPYTILDRRTRKMFKERMKEAPEMRVRLSTNSFGAADHLTTYSANYRLRSKIVHGLKFDVYEMKPEPEMMALRLANFADLHAQGEAENNARDPYLSIHAKTYVVDGRVSFVGTYNLDPRSYYINSECGVFIEDEAISEDLRVSLLRDMAPQNSYVIAKRRGPISTFTRPIEKISTSMPVDPWPIRTTSGFELLPGEEPLPRDDPDFYNVHRDLGSFPGSEGLLPQQALTRVFKVFGKAATPLL